MKVSSRRRSFICCSGLHPAEADLGVENECLEAAVVRPAFARRLRTGLGAIVCPVGEGDAEGELRGDAEGRGVSRRTRKPAGAEHSR
jgi:hypothetical protein